MIRSLIHEIAWRYRHPLWDRDADLTLRGLGHSDHDRGIYLTAAAREFNVQQQRHLRHDAGHTVCMLAAAGVTPHQAPRYLRAIRRLSPWNPPAAAELITRCVARGRVFYEDYVRLVVLLPVGQDAPINVDDVRAGRVTGNDLVWRLTT